MIEIQWRDRLQPALEEGPDGGKPLLLYFWTLSDSAVARWVP